LGQHVAAQQSIGEAAAAVNDSVMARRRRTFARDFKSAAARLCRSQT
jgi:hypothetical protein